MSYVAQNLVLDHSQSRGAARLVFLCLCRYINYSNWEGGEWAEAYPSQSTIAAKCNCSRSTVQRSLDDLQKLGEISDTGERWKRETIVWRLHLDDWRDGYLRADLTQDRSGQGPDLTYSGSGQPDMTHGGSGPASRDDDLTHPAHDLTHPAHDLTHPAHDLTHPGAQEGSKKVFKEGNKEGSSVPLDLGFPSGENNSNNNSLTPVADAVCRLKIEQANQTLDELEQALITTSIPALRASTERRISETKAELAELEGGVAA